MTCTVIGFPLGRNTTEVKVAETESAYSLGCDEFDMVINVGKLKASAGIRSYEDAKALIEAGADLLGTSAGIAIINNAPKS